MKIFEITDDFRGGHHEANCSQFHQQSGIGNRNMSILLELVLNKSEGPMHNNLIL